jgi:UDP-glucose 4-epimerase
VFDSLENGHRAAVPLETLVIGQLGDRQALAELLSRHSFDGVIHFAGYIEARESALLPGKYYQNNLVNTLTLLDLLVERGPNRIVFSSSAGVYGKPNAVPIEESTCRSPINPYSVTKAMVEEVLADYSRAYGLQSVSLRYFNAAGAHPSAELGEAHRQESHLIPRVIRVAAGLDEQISIYGIDHDTPDGTCIRDYVHVCDLATAHLRALEYLTATDQTGVFNVGTGRGYSVREIVETVQRVTGRPVRTSHAPRFEGDPPALVANASLIQEQLGWQSQSSDLEQIIESAWRWHRQNPSGFAD